MNFCSIFFLKKYSKIIQIIAILLIETIVIIKTFYILDTLEENDDRCMIYSLSADEKNYEFPIVCKFKLYLFCKFQLNSRVHNSVNSKRGIQCFYSGAYNLSFIPTNVFKWLQLCIGLVPWRCFYDGCWAYR